MEDIRIGEYFRTKKWKIHKWSKGRTYIGNDEILKHSFDIIDLIEVGDYVNGILVTGKESTLLYTEIKGIDRSGYHIPISQYGEGIKTILTKEQYNSNCYRMEVEQ